MKKLNTKNLLLIQTTINSMSLHSIIFWVTFFLSFQIHSISSQSTLCRTSCGSIPIKYPLSIDHGCGSPYYRHMLFCEPNSTDLRFRTPSGTYTVKSISYSDPHLVISDPSMWTCHSDGKPAPPFSLDTSTRFSLSPKNEFLFLNCQEDSVIIQPKPKFCERFPERCDSACDSSAYLCRNMPGCMDALVERRISCCSYYPKASASLRMMMSHCEGYSSVYWRDLESSFGVYDQAPEFGVRVDFEIPVTTRCLRCRDQEKGGGTCGFDTTEGSFLCLCKERNATTFCTDGGFAHKRSAGLIAVTVVSFAGVAGIGALVWYIKKMRTNKVTCGVQTNENRFF
ncbi:wall-associated receptor kinase-like 15 isoform X2 [Dioscorea cayenensis subsp. rotundata]|uniref:Wall-associated receptor kinase-like 15 isoform X2 n=1 Tax=Dioscorea cayennensis subsp. rotundata TaxID=55577 RepID=A0AB40CUT8_DIOCR|nr:wall-associated receptor kinase-like 15 isoform X2 [Dioscorea cayenensis subsp. rotundata]